MEIYYRQALKNIVRFGDTDIFPFPIENHVLHDKPDEAVAILTALDADVPRSLAEKPPANVGALAAVGYTGFRWATQIDPFWNAAYLSWVLSIAQQIEDSRVPVERQQVFSYRYLWNEAESTCFRRDIGWRSFIERALEKAHENAFVVSCDISEFYLRVNHHRIENSILHLPDAVVANSKIRAFLSNLSGTYSFGLPVGGPASRLLSELVLGQIDSLLGANNVDFIRYSDDYFLFTNSPDESFKALVTLTKLLIENQGLQLQKSKTRIMSSAEFIASNPLVHDDDEPGVGSPLGAARQAVMTMSVHYDPYSPTAPDDYQRLQDELDRYPILELIRAELSKSRVNISLSRRLIALTRHLNSPILDDALLSLIESEEVLYPVYFNVLITAKEVFQTLQAPTQVRITEYVKQLITNQSRIMVIDINLQYAIRLLAMRFTEPTRIPFSQLYRSDKNDAVKRDIILALARWNDWHWLSDVKNRFRAMPDLQRRAFIVASFGLGDEGEHWRRHLRREFNNAEQLVRDWASERYAAPDRLIPL